MEFRIKAQSARVVPLDGRVLVVIDTTADEIEAAIKDRPINLDRYYKRLEDMVREENTPEPAESPKYVPEPVYGPIKRRLDDGWPANVSEKARKMFGGDNKKE